jgi:exopolyphosphatase / guanosine-5'-triphosphate,3'-diphosphate pyrophosphatase
VPPGLPDRRVGAVVDLGSTSVHHLVAAIDEHSLEVLVDESTFLGLGAAADERGQLGPAGREELVDALAGYAWTARTHGAEPITFVATEPLRRLADAARIVAEVDARIGVPVHVLQHEEEALLTLLGVTGGVPVERDLLVVDIGGGSSELAFVGPRRQPEIVGLKIGAAALTRGHDESSPPTAETIAAMKRAAADALAAAPAWSPVDIVLVGGTATNLAKVTQSETPRTLFRRSDLDALDRQLARTSSDQLAGAYTIRPARAALLPAGAAIVRAVAERFGATEVNVVDSGIREGALIAVDRAGPAWRDRLAPLAHGWAS